MTEITFDKRIISGLIDATIIMGVLIFLLLLLFIFGLANNILSRILLLSFIYSLLLCKDIFQGQSIGKRIVKLRVKNTDNSRASLYKLVLRNLFFIIWPVEFIMCYINPQRRLGDIVVGTKLTHDHSKENTTNTSGCFLTFLMVLGLWFIFMYSMSIIFKPYFKLIYS
ncbi:MAG: RDD family protein [Dysgonomonas sp.]